MGIEVASRKAEVLVIPFPAQGHINPSLAFAKCLASKGLVVSLITTTAIANSATFSSCASVTIHSVSDGSEHLKEAETIEGYFSRFRGLYARNLEEFIDGHKSSATAIIVYDSIMPWVLDIAHERGLLGASFFTQTCGVSSVFYHLRQGLLRYPYEGVTTATLPALPELEKRYLPSFAHIEDPDQIVVRLLTDQFSNLERADWIFFNTFDKLETEIIQWMRMRWPITTVGPTFLLDHGHGHDKLSGSKNHTISLFEPKQDACREWLDSKETASVVYVSFGSIASLGKEQMEELAYGLVMSGCYFLWVVRSSELDKLPQDFTTSTAITDHKGLVVEWCHQPEVLAHRAVACFMTHCGWNSTLEALSNGVPLVAMAQWVDQNTNAKFIEDVWGVGVGVKRGENGIIGRQEIALCMKKVVGEDELGVELKRNACRWKELASEAVKNGGTSANNVEDFVSKLKFGESGEISPTSVLA